MQELQLLCINAESMLYVHFSKFGPLLMTQSDINSATSATKLALITGGTSGIGVSIAKALLNQGQYGVVLIGRNASKGNAVIASLEAAHPGRAKFVQLDLSDIGAVKKFAKQFAANHESLDLLANVAGVMQSKRTLTKEGFETTFAVGYLSAFVLCTELAPLLEKTPHGRIANVAGVARFIFNGKLDFDDLTFKQGYSSFKTAITTVHAKTVLTEILSQKFASKGIDVNSFHPGAVRSDLMHNMPWLTRQLFKIPSFFMTKESKTGIFACLSPELEGVSGKYLNGKQVLDLNFGAPYKERLWLETEKLLLP